MTKMVKLHYSDGSEAKPSNLYVPGLDESGTPRFLVNSPLFWANQSSDQLRGGPGEYYAPEVDKAHIDRLGYSSMVCLTQTNVETGAIERRIMTPNLLLDNGGVQLLKLFTTAAGSLGQYLVLDTNAAANQLTGSITAAQDLTTFNTSNGPAIVSGGTATLVTGNAASTYISNTTTVPCTSAIVGTPDPSTGGAVVLGYGLATTEYFSGSGTQSNAANVKASAGVAKNLHNVGEWVVANPKVTDGPAGTLPGTAIIWNSGSATNGATASANTNSTPTGSGTGNRSVVFSNYLFSTTSTAASYNNLWVVTATTIAGNSAATNYISHLSFPPLIISTSNTITVTYTIKV